MKTETKKASKGKLELNRETVSSLGVKSGVQTGIKVDSHVSCGCHQSVDVTCGGTCGF